MWKRRRVPLNLGGSEGGAARSTRTSIIRRPTSLVLGTVACGLLLAACGSAKTAASSTSTSTSTTIKKVAVVDCPLTDTPAPGNVVSRWPAVAMKVDNYSLGPPPAEARPQSGLDFADIVYEEQVEGAITRYAAVFQCRNAPALVGPIRSARWTDIQMLSELGHPILVHVGGILPVLALINSSPLVNLDLGYNASLESNPPGRYAPYDTYTTTQAVWSHEKQLTAPPPPVFTFSTTPPKGRSVSQFHLDWSGTSDIYWRWNATTRTWLRYYNVGSTSAPDIKADLLSDGVQNQAQNVIVQDVNITYGPWVENAGGGLEAESHIIGQSGKAYVFRNGTMIVGTWTSKSASSPTTYVDGAGKIIALDPGRTWVEIYPSGAPLAVISPTPTSSGSG